MGEREQFLKEYQEQVLDTLTLPPEWSVRYTVQSCLKDGERQVYLLRDQAGRQAVLKTQPAGREDALRQEYLNAIMRNAREVLDNTYIVDEKGNKRRLKGKGEQG